MEKTMIVQGKKITYKNIELVRQMINTNSILESHSSFQGTICGIGTPPMVNLRIWPAAVSF